MAATSNIIIREGTPSDNEGLEELTALTPMEGNISIRIDRKPDFFRLLKMRGSSFVMVAELNHKIIGSYSISAIRVYINGKQETVYYLGDFKVHPDHRSSTVAIRLVRAGFHKLDSMNADLLYCTVASGNNAVAPFFTSRAFLPKGEKTGTFNIFQIIPSPFHNTNKTYVLKACPFDTSYISFFNHYSMKYQMGPVYSESTFKNATLLTAFLNNEPVAALALCDVAQAKQTILIRLSWKLKIAAALISGSNAIIPLMRTPRINGMVRIWYIKSFACQPGHEEALKILVAKARYLAWKKKYHFLNIAIHSKDPLLKIFSKTPKFTFETVGYVSSLKNNTEKIEGILNGVMFEDYSVV